MLHKKAILSLVIAVVSLILLDTSDVHIAHAQGPTPTSPNLKVAFIGDQGITNDATALLQLIASEGADMVLHQGDLGYGNESDPQTAINWDNMITTQLGSDFPYFASIGNHDLGNWSVYQQKLQERLDRIPGATCVGDLGVNSACTYEGLFFILSGIGTMGSGHVAYLKDQFALDNSIWRVCSWHKNQREMQVGGKGNETGWNVYEVCRRQGAIVATGHEHSYSRTRTLSDMSAQTVSVQRPDANDLAVGSGYTFAFVSGMGGFGVRNQERCLPTTFPYGCNGEWASIYTSNQGAETGALFIEFNVNGNARNAVGYFKDIDGNVPDSFTIRAVKRNVGTISGTVVDDDTSLPIQDATVLVGGRLRDTTDANGNYTIHNVPQGQIPVIASKSGYKRKAQLVTVIKAQTTIADFSLKPR